MYAAGHCILLIQLNLKMTTVVINVVRISACNNRLYHAWVPNAVKICKYSPIIWHTGSGAEQIDVPPSIQMDLGQH